MLPNYRTQQVYVWKLVLLLLWVCVGPVLPECIKFQPDQEPVTCDTMTYEPCWELLGPRSGNFTSFPNILGQDSSEAISTLQQSTNISDILRHSPNRDCGYFICYMFFPLCSPGTFSRINPCREYCMDVFTGCLQDLSAENNWPWLNEVECDAFPAQGSEICIMNSDNECPTTTTDTPTPSPPSDTSSPTPTLTTPTTDSVPNATVQSRTNCTGLLVPHPDNKEAKFDGIHGCVESCKGVFLNEHQQNLAQIWIAAFSLLCLLFSIVVFLTFLLVCNKVSSPVTPVYYIALCYAFVSLAYIISVAVGKNSLICNHEHTNELNESALAIEGVKLPLCGAVFSLLYYSTLCTWSWWVVQSFQWMFCCWKQKPINLKWRVCSHIVAWGIPLVFLLSALLTGKVSGEPFFGTCWIRQRQELPFLIVPLLVVVVWCSLVILVCFARIVQLQRHSKQTSDEPLTADVSVTTLWRVGLYSIFYLLSMGALLCCYSYDYWYRLEWEYWYIHCRDAVAHSRMCSSLEEPRFSVLLVKFSASVAMGILSIFWIAHRNSYSAWRKALCLCCDQKNSGSFNIAANGTGQFGKEQENLHEHPLAFLESSL